MERQVFGTSGWWQDAGYYNNEAFRLEAEMNKLCGELEEKYAKHSRIMKKRNQIHRSIGKATHQPEGMGYIEEDVKLPLFRKDKKPLERPPNSWVKFVQPIKNGDTTGLDDGGDGLSTQVELADDSAGSRDYEIQPDRSNQNKNQRRGKGQQGQQHNQQQHGG